MSSSRPHIPPEVRKQIANEAGHRCGYCLTSRHFTAKILHVEHIIPLAAGGGTAIENLWLACDLCNSYKGTRSHAIDPLTRQTVPLFNPRQQTWQDHFAWNENSTRIVGLTPMGRATVVALRLNHPFQVEARGWWVKAGWHPPVE